MKFLQLIFVGAFFSLSTLSFAQKKNAHIQYHIKQASDSIIIDGKMTETAWKNAQVAEKFGMVLPMDTSVANLPTEVRMTYDKKNIYILATCYKPALGKDMVESLKRDWNFGKNDNFLLFMDTYGDLTNGFAFGSFCV